MTYLLREVPDFLVVGGTFCAKSYLYSHIAQHDCVFKALKDETAFFYDWYDKGQKYYRPNFPTSIYKSVFKVIHGRKLMVGESMTLPYREVPERVFKVNPNPKIIIILRNPIDRAYASYLAMVRKGKENYSFQEAILRKVNRWASINRVMAERNILMTENRINGFPDNEISTYLRNSIYVDDVKRWAEFFPKENMLFLKSEELFESPILVTNRVLEFIGLEQLNQISVIDENLEKDSEVIESGLRKELVEFFRPFNEKLYQFIGQDFGWDAPILKDRGKDHFKNVV
jgi:hypothetical protein